MILGRTIMKLLTNESYSCEYTIVNPRERERESRIYTIILFFSWILFHNLYLTKTTKTTSNSEINVDFNKESGTNDDSHNGKIYFQINYKFLKFYYFL